MAASRPVWGAWIEIAREEKCSSGMLRRAPYGARGLKLVSAEPRKAGHGRAPYGARGLKFGLELVNKRLVFVAPRMGRVD